jgi:hypothetical protein
MIGIAIAAAAAVSLAACAMTRVNASLERGMSFAQYTSYAWAAEDRFSTGDPRLDNNEFFERRLQTDVERVLAARGYEKASPATAALIVHYHASVNQKMDVNALDRQYGYCEQCHSSIYDAGTITIDLVDARTNRLVWRGWSEGTLDGIDNQALLEARVDDAVTKILQKLPPM